MTIAFLATALILTLISGMPGLLLKAGSRASQRTATVLHCLGCSAGLVAALLGLANDGFHLQFSWPLPGGVTAIHVDALSAFFLLPLFLVTGLGSVYGEGYWPESVNPANGRKLRFFYGTITAGLTLVMIAGDAWSFLFGWEITGLSAFFLVTTERSNKEALRAGWIYLIATHTATLALFAMFSVLRTATGTWLLDVSVTSGSSFASPILVLALLAFGIKAGLMPFHVWLPEAHAAAPSHISAILSGIVLKMGVYGLIRVMTLVYLDRWFGLALLFAGILSGVLGVVFALAQHDLKRLLAYHSIENIGIIFIGLGACVLARNEPWGAFAFAGAALHVWNHAFFKALLFFAAGSVVHATGTRSIDHLGGLLPSLRTTGLSFLVGAVAICGLPPLNGFVSEWLIYMAGFRAAIPGSDILAGAAILAVPALALIGALAIACFVKAFSVVFLGHPRSDRSVHEHGERISIRFVMMALVAVCVVIGVWPLVVSGILSNLTALVLGDNRAGMEIRSMLSGLGVAGAVALVTIASAIAVLTPAIRQVSKKLTWDCGYEAPTGRMQYTASSFAGLLTSLFDWALRPDVHRTREPSLFPNQESFNSHVPDPVLDRFLVPNISRGQRLMAFAHFIQAGRIQVYILYVVATLLILLAWSSS